MSSGWRVIGRVAADRELRRVGIGFAGFAIAEHGTWLASIMYAYDRGGVDEAGLAAVALLSPGLLVAPIAAFAADRYESGRVLAAGYAIQATAMLLSAFAIATDAPAGLVYLGLAAAASGVTLTRPAIGVVLPESTRTPADLTAANVVVGFAEYGGMFVGPALTGVLVGTVDLAAPFAVCGALTACAAILALGLRTGPRLAAPGTGGASAGVVRQLVDGLRALRDHSTVRMTIVMLSLGSLVIGAADLLFVATADQLTPGDTSRAGVLGTAFGVGAVLGAVLTVLLVGRARLSPWIAGAVATMGLSLASLASATVTPAAVAAFVVMGGGESVLRISATTLIQRVAPSDVVGRFFGVAEGLHMFSIAIGSGVVGLLVAQLGYERGLLVAGSAVPILLLLRIARLLRIDRDAVPPDEAVLAAILGDDIFGALPAPIVERLAADAERRHVAAGSVVIAEGDRGDHYFVIEHGEVEVTMQGRHVRVIGRGGSFGELALLRDVARTATVTAATDLELLAFDREAFLRAVSGHARSTAIGRERVVRFLGEP